LQNANSSLTILSVFLSVILLLSALSIIQSAQAQSQQQQQAGGGSDKCPPNSRWDKMRAQKWTHPVLNGIFAGFQQAGLSLQLIENSDQPVKYDLYAVVVKRMPPGLTPEEFLNEMAVDMNKAVNNRVFNDINVFKKVTSSEPGIGSIYYIDMKGPDNGSVILVDKTPSSFILQIIISEHDGKHPEQGAREFGFERVEDGSVIFYTRGVSQADLGFADPLGKALQKVGWTAMMKGIAIEMSRRGGLWGGLPVYGGLICEQDESKPPQQESSIPMPNFNHGDWTNTCENLAVFRAPAGGIVNVAPGGSVNINEGWEVICVCGRCPNE
jgi:hypothetical protein